MEIFTLITKDNDGKIIKQTNTWKVSYRYTSPSGAGPFKGRMNIKGDKPKRGDDIYGPFGEAVITSVHEIK